jgi:hypothetical protein
MNDDDDDRLKKKKKNEMMFFGVLNIVVDIHPLLLFIDFKYPQTLLKTT